MASPLTARAALLLELDRGPGYGLDLIERYRERTGERGPLQGSIYPALRGLLRGGLLEEVGGAQRPPGGGRPRRYYRLTHDGSVATAQIRAILRAML